jgi:hypothetical protein
MLARDLARLMYGEEITPALGYLVRRYQMDFLNIRAFEHETRKLLVGTLRLNKFDGKANFCTWNHFVLVGMYGQTEAARPGWGPRCYASRSWRAW